MRLEMMERIIEETRRIDPSAEVEIEHNSDTCDCGCGYDEGFGYLVIQGREGIIFIISQGDDEERILAKLEKPYTQKEAERI